MAKHREFLKYYKAFAHLYGAIPLNEAYDILFDFGVPFSLEDMEEDIRSRGGCCDEVTFWISEDDKFLISDITFSSNFGCPEPVFNLLEEQSKRPYYRPDSLSELLLYKDLSYLNKKTIFYKELFYFMKSILQKRKDKDLIDINEVMYSLDYVSKIGLDVEHAFVILNKTFSIILKGENRKIFSVLFYLFDANRRKWTNSGWSNLELIIMDIMNNKDNLDLSLNSEIKEQILNRELEASNLVELINLSPLPNHLKDSLLNEIKDVIKKLDKNAA